MDATEPNPLPTVQEDLEPSQPATSFKPESKLVRTLKNVSPFTYFFAAVLTISLIALAYFMLQNLSLKSQMGMNSFRLPWVSVTCTYQGQEFKPSESVPSIDGCNTCSCSDNGQVACTLMACDITNPPSPDDEPITLTPDQSGKFNLTSARLGFSTSFNAQDMLTTSCQGGRGGYEFWIYSSNTDTRAGVCSYEGPVGILLSHVEDVSQIECWPDDEVYSLQKSEKVINNNSLLYCQSTLKDALPDYLVEPSFVSPITFAFIRNPSDGSAIAVWMQDPKLQPVFDQILSTFEFTN